MSNGAFWFHRKIEFSAVWSASLATYKGFTACLMFANFKDQHWFSRAEHKQVLIPRGSFFMTMEKFSERSNLTLAQTRECWKNLSDLEVITLRTTRRGTFITVLNYDQYQKVATQRATRGATQSQHNSNTIATQLEEGKEREERKEGESLSFFVSKWQRREDRKEFAAEIAMGLKAYKLSFRVEEDMYNKIMGVEDGTIRSQSISEQVAERVRQGKLERPRKPAGEILAGIRNLPKVQPDTQTDS